MLTRRNMCEGTYAFAQIPSGLLSRKKKKEKERDFIVIKIQLYSTIFLLLTFRGS